jgi:endoglucanase
MVRRKPKIFLTQIANYFKDFDEHLLFAGTNEVYGSGGSESEYVEIQKSFV